MHGRVAVLAGLVVVVVVGMIVALTWAGDDAEDPDETARPAFAVLKPKDAALAVEGHDGDFEVVHEITPSEGEGTEAILPDGRLVVVRSEQEDLETYHYLDLVDPSSGEREEVPAPWHDAAPGTYPAVTVLDDDRLMVAWSDSERGDSEDRVMVLDLDTGEHEEFTRPAVSLDRGVKVLSYPEPGGDGRSYFQTGRQLCGDGECFTPRRGVLWSFAPGDDDARQEMEGVVEFAVAGDLLAWVPESPNSTIKVRDLVTGDEHGYTLRGSCTIGGLIASATLVVLACPNSQRHVVIDAEARPVVDLRLSYEYPSVGDRWIMVSPFAYDTQTGRLLRLFDRTGADSTRELGGDLSVVPLGPADSGYSGNADRSDRWAIVRLSDREDVVGDIVRPPAPYTCWNGRRAFFIEKCGYPRDAEGMSWMFPDSTADGCDAVDPGGRRTREIWCRDVEVAGRTADLHFSDWKGPRDVDSHYAGDRIGPLPDPFVEARAFEVRSARGAKGVLRYFGYRVDDWSVSVYADSREDLIAVIAGLQIRPGADWRATQRQE